MTAKPLGDVRMAATRAVERAGFRYILADDGGGGYGVLGAAMAHHEGEWGLERVGEVGPVVLLRIK